MPEALISELFKQQTLNLAASTYSTICQVLSLSNFGLVSPTCNSSGNGTRAE